MAQKREDVKSTAVVKYAAVDMPAQFQQLQQNTDLKQPPSNWLHANSKWESYIRNLSFKKGQTFSSFKMGHCYPDLTGEIDVVSDAENIKKMLKIPYSKGHVSMMVHRVGNTLLLDDFDIHKHLLRQQEKDWQWLRKFYYETIVQNMQEKIKDQMHMIKKNKSRDHLQNRNMFSKFLYYSIGKSSESETDSTDHTCPHPASSETLRTSPSPLVPDASQQAENEAHQEHQRTQVWTFEDIQMLVGTDLPIFGGGTHPCISLRLRNMRQPINVLTGIDYWLDNLICNVPELAMCYHLDGIVQSYELLKTEDIPKMPKSEFSPGVIRDVAQNILSFLKSNATKEGHTYWLFKGHGDDIVKLYDLTTLCTDVQENNTNPFTVPVGMLLYRVARNMRQNHGRKKSGTIRTLLKNCLQLLDRDLHAQIVTSAEFLLSDLYVADDFLNPEPSPDISDESDTEDESSQDDPSPQDIGSKSPKDKAPVTTIDVQALCLPESSKKTDGAKQDVVWHPPVTGTSEERCSEAMKHITQGLFCLDQSISKVTGKEDEVISEEKQATCNPDIAIPLHYSPIKTPKSAASSEEYMGGTSKSTNQKSTSPPCEKASSNQVSVFSRTSLPEGSWHRRSKYLLLKKGTIANYSLANKYLSLKHYGRAWKRARIALETCCTQKSLSLNSEDNLLLSCVLALLGDVHLMMAHNRQEVLDQKHDFATSSDTDETMLNSCRLEFQMSEFDWIEPVSVDIRENLERSCHCYQSALQELNKTDSISEMQMDISKRLGNILNELGVHYMNAAATKMTENAGEADLKSEIQDLSGKSCTCFEQGITQFTELDDSLNIALLYSNLGRLRRLHAQFIRQDLESRLGNCDFSPQESQLFSKAQDCYQKAMKFLLSRETNPDIWDSVVWELSSTCFTMASLLQDHAPLATKAQEQVEREVIRLMEKSLANCKVIPNTPRYESSLYRAATIHHRMASLYHNAYRNQMDDRKLRYLRTHAEDQYTRAISLFLQAGGACELLRVQLERVALYEYYLQKQTSPITKLKTLHQALQCLRSSRSSVDLLSSRLIPKSEEAEERDGLKQEAEKLLGIFVSRLQFITLNMVKISSKKGKKVAQASTEDYKEMYGVILKSRSSDSSLHIATRCQELSRTLNAVDKLCSQSNPDATSQKPTDHPDDDFER